MKQTTIYFLLSMMGMAGAYALSPSTPMEVLHQQERSNYTAVHVKAWPVQHKRVIFKKASRIVLYSGSLKDNITRVARHFGWKKVVWLPNHDYRWVGRTRLPSGNIYKSFTHVLRHYPLQAVFYQGNHVLVISPRNI